MDIGDYWATFVSIILGLGLADLLINFSRLLHERKRVTWDGLPLAWAVVALLQLINYWWAVAANLTRWRETRVALEFAWDAVAPIILFLIAASLLPRTMPADGRLEMRAEWEKSRGLFLALGALYQALAWINVAFGRGITWDVAAIVRTIVLASLVLALVLKNRLVDWAAGLIILGVLLWRLSVQPVG